MKKILTVLLSCLISTAAVADVRIIVPFAIGGAFDQIARNFGRYIENTTGENVTVENVTGAGSIVATQRFLGSNINPNTTIIFSSSSHFVNLVNETFNENQFRVASILGEAPYFLIGTKTKNFSCENLRDNSKNFFVGTTGKDSSSSAALAIIMKYQKNFTEVPYKGVSMALVDLIADRVDLSFAAGYTHAARPELKIIANTTKKSIDGYPSWTRCLGVKDNFVVEYVAITRIDADVAFSRRINDLAVKFVNDPVTVKQFKEIGIVPSNANLEQTQIDAKESLENWKAIFGKK